MSHDLFMQRCLQLARNGIPNAFPNPLVGCVIVHNDQIIGEGWHRQYGREHAEVNAINSVKTKELLTESTLYVNLEPCAHHGKTPPCADLIVKMRIPGVVIGTRDPFSKVDGLGIDRLKAAGVDVQTDILPEECYHLNRRFFTFHKSNRPYVILKWAETSDGFIDKLRRGEKGVNWISGKSAKILVHKWRSEEDGILVGRRTLETDNPSLTTRLWVGKDPHRILITNNAPDPDAAIFKDPKAKVYVASGKAFENLPAIAIDIGQGKKAIPQLLDKLREQEIHSLIVEGGASTIGHFIDTGLWDEARVLTGAVEYGKGLQAPTVGVKASAEESIGNDVLKIYYNE